MAKYNARPRKSAAYQNGKKKKKSIWKRIFPAKGDGFFEGARKIIFIGALGCFLWFGGNVAFDYGNDLYQNYQMREKINKYVGNFDIPDDVRNDANRRVPGILPEYIMAWNQNNDLVGHIMIPDITLPVNDPKRNLFEYLVYQRLEHDGNGRLTGSNRYYLDRTPEHTYSKGGSIYADFRNRFKDGELSENTIIYGHNMASTGNYFTKVASYYKEFEQFRSNKNDKHLDYYKKHPIVTFNTIYEKSDWKVFACVLFNTDADHGEVYKYLKPEFTSKDDFNEFILDIMDRSVLFTDVDLEYGDHILTLSTCYWPFGVETTRVVLFARKVRDGESSAVNVEKASYNLKFLPFDMQRRRLGNTWDGRVWNTDYLLSYDG